jgi:hypothetical protein
VAARHPKKDGSDSSSHIFSGASPEVTAPVELDFSVCIYRAASVGGCRRAPGRTATLRGDWREGGKGSEDEMELERP